MKGQSAMEYLMTYGWSILIIAIALIALFELGILGGPTLPTTCVAQSGFVCSNPSVLGANGGSSVIVTVGQSSGQTYSNVYLAYSDILPPINGVGFLCVHALTASHKGCVLSVLSSSRVASC